MLNARFFQVTAVFAVSLALAAMLGYFEEREIPNDSTNSSVVNRPTKSSSDTHEQDPAKKVDDRLRAVQTISQKAEQIAPPNAQTIARSIEATLGDDADARAAGIGVLALAPKAQALPALQKILTAGIDADRQFALSSLHTLALREGDADGEIQNVLRLAIYDGDDTIASGAQIVLEEIERNSSRLTAGISR